MRTIQEEAVLAEHENFGDAPRGLGRFLDEVHNPRRTQECQERAQKPEEVIRQRIVARSR